MGVTIAGREVDSTLDIELFFMTKYLTTRLAPSPTGALHLGNARTFMINWALAKQRNWQVLMRIEDLDTPRMKAGAREQAIEDLHWLGMQWDGEASDQMSDLSPYQQALDSLHQQGHIYPCTCSRKQIESNQSALSAPHASDRELRYPGTCRPTIDSSSTSKPDDRTSLENGRHPQVDLETDTRTGTDSGIDEEAGPRVEYVSHQHEAAWRVKIPDETIVFQDQFAGSQTIETQQQVGDFVIATKSGLPAYQLAVVVDDARQGITDIVRGDDLIDSTARQLWLYRMLNLGPEPTYWHLPLVVGEDGKRLAKRHGDSQLAWYRAQGVDSQRIIGLIGYWCGVTSKPTPMTSDTFAKTFDLQRMARTPVVFQSGDHQWLLNQ